jgi:2-iminobutanoate/2-iminopropanoate deaminase
MAKRRSMDIPGLVPHKNPIKHCVKIGNMIFSGGITGFDPKTGELPGSLDDQARCAFANMKTLVEGAGGSTDDIAKVEVFMRDTSDRDAINREWVAMFPDEDDRPARHAIKAELGGGILVQLEIVAVL